MTNNTNIKVTQFHNISLSNRSYMSLANIRQQIEKGAELMRVDGSFGVFFVLIDKHEKQSRKIEKKYFLEARPELEALYAEVKG